MQLTQCQFTTSCTHYQAHNTDYNPNNLKVSSIIRLINEILIESDLKVMNL